MTKTGLIALIIALVSVEHVGDEVVDGLITQIWNFLIAKLLTCLSFTQSLSYLVMQLLGPSVTQSLSHSVTQSLNYVVT